METIIAAKLSQTEFVWFEWDTSRGGCLNHFPPPDLIANSTSHQGSTLLSHLKEGVAANANVHNTNVKMHLFRVVGSAKRVLGLAGIPLALRGRCSCVEDFTLTL